MATQSSSSANFVGQVLDERYRLESVLGTGGMGAVYLARDLKTDAVLAIKLLHQLGPGTEDQHQRFFDEALNIGQLFHPNIVQVIGFNKDKDGRPFMIMELLRGKDLYDVLEERGKLPLQKALEIVGQVGSALHAAHNIGVAHRDIKPSNIFLARKGNSEGEEVEVVKVVDFGLSKEVDNEAMRRTARGIIVGTLEYASPEATTGDSSLVDFQSDQWALAVVTYRMLSGKLPFAGENVFKLISAIREQHPVPLRRHAPELPEHVIAAIERAMAKDKEKRFDSVQDFVRALNGLPSLSKSLSNAGDSRIGKGGRRSSRPSISAAESAADLSSASRQIEKKPESSSWRRLLLGLFAAVVVLSVLTAVLWYRQVPHGAKPPAAKAPAVPSEIQTPPVVTPPIVEAIPAPAVPATPSASAALAADEKPLDAGVVSKAHPAWPQHAGSPSPPLRLSGPNG